MELPPLKVDKDFPAIRKSRMGTGIRDLDIIIEGGYGRSALVLIKGPTGNEKNAFVYHFMKAGIDSGEKVVYVALDIEPSGLERKALLSGVVLDTGKVRFIDCYSHTIGKADSQGNIFVPGPTALNDLSLAIKEATDEAGGKPFRLVVHSLSTLAVYNPEASVIKFLQVVGGRLKTANATVLMTLEEGMHSKQLSSALEHSADVEYVIEERDGKMFLKVPDLTCDVEFRLGPSGITLP
ncbi:MAG: RAD55 family ATPase [Candidatus Bilamarchaeaceae archaeon]